MVIKCENQNGKTIEISSFRGSTPQYMLTEIDFGAIPENVTAESVFGADGAIYSSSSFGTRDITIRFFNMNGSASECRQALSPKSEIRLTFNELYYISGKVVGISAPKRPASRVPMVYSFTVRCFCPYFFKVGEVVEETLTASGTLKEFTLENVGDVECPFEATLNGDAAFYLEVNGGRYSGSFTDFEITTDRLNPDCVKGLSQASAPFLPQIKVGEQKIKVNKGTAVVRFKPRYSDISEEVSR